MKRLFVDYIRIPKECVHYMNGRPGVKSYEYLQNWKVIVSYEKFVNYINTEGIPDLISFDHDLRDKHYLNPNEKHSETYIEKTGHHCLKWLINYCLATGEKMPECWIHTMNPLGKAKMEDELKYLK